MHKDIGNKAFDANGRSGLRAGRNASLAVSLVFLQICFLSLVSLAQSFSLEKSGFPAGGGTSSNGQFTITVTLGEPVAGFASGGGFSVGSGFRIAAPANDPPTANSLALTTPQNITLPIILSGSDLNGDALSFTVTLGPSHGLLTGTAPNLTYTPAHDYTGSDSFKFTITDSHGATSQEAMVNLTVSPLNHVPVALPQSLTTGEEIPLALTLTATDVESNPLTFQIATLPARGTLSGSAPNLTYTPALNFNGMDSFTFTASDGVFTSLLATIVIQVTPMTDVAPAAFLQPMHIPTGLAPWAVAAGKLNADKNMDLVVANSETNTLTILLGNGLGAFTNSTTINVGTHPSAVVIGNFNSSLDAFADLAVANADDNTVSILLGHGDGTFAPPVTMPVGQHPISLAAADLNGDTYIDLLVANHDSGSISVLLGTGSGFAAPMHCALAVGVNTVATGDFNGDRKVDVITANSSVGIVTLLLGNGAGAFSSTNSFAAGPLAIGLALGDFNGDRKLDVATANQSSNTVTVLLGNNKGSFTNTTSYAVNGNPVAVAALDFNKDNKLDLAIANWTGNSVDVIAGTGNGSFNYYFNDSATHFNVGNQPVAMVVADLDADSNNDLAVAVSSDDQLAVLLNNFTPKAFNQTFVVLEDSATPIALSAQGGPPLNFTFRSLPTQGALTGIAPNLTYAPAANFNGKDSFTYVVDDGFKTSRVATVSLNVLPVNDPPSFTLLLHDITVAEDSGKLTLLMANDVSSGPANENRQSLSFLMSNDATNLFSLQPKLTVSRANASLAFTPAPNAHGVAHLAVQLQDNGGTANGGTNVSTIQNFTITITPVNDAPVVSKLTLPTVLEDGSVVVNFSANDVETAADSLTYSVTRTNTALFPNPAVNLILGGSGTNRTLTITPAANEFGTDRLTLTVSDGTNATTQTNLVITVTAVNDVPAFDINTATYGTGRSVSHTNAQVTLPNFAINRSAGPPNESSQTLSFVVSTATPELFTTQPAVNASGTLTFKPKSGTANGAVAQIFIRIKDNGSATAPNLNLSAAQAYTITITNP